MTESNATVLLKTHMVPVCDRDSKRYSLGGVLITETGRAVACDGRVLAITKVDVEGTIGQKPNEDGDYGRVGWNIVPAAIIKKPTANKPTKLILNGKVECPANEKIGNYVEGRYPRAGQVLMELRPDSFAVTIDAALLKNLADALLPVDSDKKGITLFFDPKDVDAPIAVLGEGENVGIIMPLSSLEDADKSYTSARSAVLADLPADLR